MYFLGIDVGSLSCDAVLIDEKKKILASSVVPTGVKNIEAIARVKKNILAASGIGESEIGVVVSTGYGRNRVAGRDGDYTEITCHARGIIHVLPMTRVLIDIGGQDSKALHLDSTGNVADFAMNDKCAAGTGRFLEAMARALEVDIDDLGELDRDAQSDLVLTSMCTVFAESEVITLIAQGTDPKEIARGLHRSVAARTYALVKRIVKSTDNMVVSMSGGVARNRGVVRAIKECMGIDTIHIPEAPDTIGALGAALLGFEKAAL